MTLDPVDPAAYPQLAGDLFEAVQRGGVFEDSKTFVDSVPTTPPGAVYRRYLAERDDPAFDLRSFVERHFALPGEATSDLDLPADRSMVEHVRLLWDHLTLEGHDDVPEGSTVVPLPHPYVEPGGRFREVYYWDSYFAAVGLAAAGRLRPVRDLARNFASLVDRFGFVPNGNRVYYDSRSQPPLFCRLVALLAREQGVQAAAPFLDYVRAEHDFWTDGADSVTTADPAHRRVVRLDDGAVLNRYWDDRATPRPEAYREDLALAERVDAPVETTYRHVRAACESGWDFSSRWFADGERIETVRTTDLVPVDLNAILYDVEATLARWLDALDATGADAFAAAAAARREAVETHCFDADRGYYFDYCWRDGERTDAWTLAGVVPLFTGLASEAHADAVADRLRERFLQPGGLVTTLTETGQQWDWPQGWAPLQYVAVVGLRRYGHDDLAHEVGRRWLATNRRVFEETGLMFEKYDVVAPAAAADVGEYPLQDGFGWTNGVVLALDALLD